MKLLLNLSLAILVVITGAFSAAQAQEHPTKKEHPAKAEHPATVNLSNQAGDLLAAAAGAGNFKTFITAVKAAGLEEQLQGKGPFTIFAPTDEAFAKLPDGTVETLLMPENKDQLVAILTYHVVPGTVTAEQVVTMTEAKTVNGAMVEIAVVDGTVKIDDAQVTQADIMTSNGVIHVIDTVLIPE